MNKQTIHDILNVRQATHGDYNEQAQVWKDLTDVCELAGSSTLDPAQYQAITLIAVKLSRILAGNPDEPDHWRDIAGYATLVADLLPTKKSKAPAVLVERAMDIVTHAKTERIVPRRIPISTVYPPWVTQELMPLLDPRQRWYMSIDNDLHVLEPWVRWSGQDGDRPPPSLDGFYTFANFPNERGWLLEIEKCPPEIRDRWDAYYVYVDRTEAELRQLLIWQQGLYELKGDKYQLKSPYKAWDRG